MQLSHLLHVLETLSQRNSGPGSPTLFSQLKALAGTDEQFAESLISAAALGDKIELLRLLIAKSDAEGIVEKADLSDYGADKALVAVLAIDWLEVFSAVLSLDETKVFIAGVMSVLIQEKKLSVGDIVAMEQFPRMFEALLSQAFGDLVVAIDLESLLKARPLLLPLVASKAGVSLELLSLLLPAPEPEVIKRKDENKHPLFSAHLQELKARLPEKKTWSAIAALAQITTTSVLDNIVRGRTVPSVENLAGLTVALICSVQELVVATEYAEMQAQVEQLIESRKQPEAVDKEAAGADSVAAAAPVETIDSVALRARLKRDFDVSTGTLLRLASAMNIPGLTSNILYNWVQAHNGGDLDQVALAALKAAMDAEKGAKTK